jgi:hypothetical protein
MRFLRMAMMLGKGSQSDGFCNFMDVTGTLVPTKIESLKAA